MYKLCFYVPESHLEEVKSAIMAMKGAHPYEQPAWDVIALVTELPG